MWGLLTWTNPIIAVIYLLVSMVIAGVIALIVTAIINYSHAWDGKSDPPTMTNKFLISIVLVYTIVLYVLWFMGG